MGDVSCFNATFQTLYLKKKLKRVFLLSLDILFLFVAHTVFISAWVGIVGTFATPAESVNNTKKSQAFAFLFCAELPWDSTVSQLCDDWAVHCSCHTTPLIQPQRKPERDLQLGKRIANKCDRSLSADLN